MTAIQRRRPHLLHGLALFLIEVAAVTLLLWIIYMRSKATARQDESPPQQVAAPPTLAWQAHPASTTDQAMSPKPSRFFAERSDAVLVDSGR